MLSSCSHNHALWWCLCWDKTSPPYRASSFSQGARHQWGFRTARWVPGSTRAGIKTRLQKPKFGRSPAVSEKAVGVLEVLLSVLCRRAKHPARHHAWPAAGWQAQGSAIFLLGPGTGFTHKELLHSVTCRIASLGLTPPSLLEKGMCSNPQNTLSRCHLWSAGAGLMHTNYVKSSALQTFPNMPFTFYPPVRPHFSTARETLGRSTYQQGCPTWEEYWGLQQLLGVWVPLADVCYSSHFINVGNKTPDYSWPKHPLFDWQPVCVSYDITHGIALATF